MVKLQKTSKRKLKKTERTIAKKVKEHNKKVKRAINKGGGPAKSKKEKPVEIPNNWPFKAQLLKQMKERKIQQEEERKQKREEEKQRRAAEREAAKKGLTYEGIAAAASVQQSSFEAAGAGGAAQGQGQAEMEDDRERGGRRAFMKELNRVVTMSDVLLEVLDARDPDPCRNLELERTALAAGKRVVLVLNKIDLVPKDALLAWMKHLKDFLPVVAFKAATGGKDVRQAKVAATDAKPGQLHSSGTAVGADSLLQLLKNFARQGSSSSSKAAISVGVVGMPNVGKSSVINSMKRAAATKVGGEAGVTRSLQEVQLDSKVKLIDSPGVVFGPSDSDPASVLRNAVKIQSVRDPAAVVEALLARCPPGSLMRHFQIPSFSGVDDFLAAVARQRGRLSSGGRPDYKAAAQLVLQDWVSGKIRYYALPPQKRQDEHAEAAIVSFMGPSMDVNALELIGKQMQDLQMADADGVTLGEAARPTDVAMQPAAAASGFGFGGDEMMMEDAEGPEAASSSGGVMMIDEGGAASAKKKGLGINRSGDDFKVRRRRAVVKGGGEGLSAESLKAAQSELPVPAGNARKKQKEDAKRQMKLKKKGLVMDIDDVTEEWPEETQVGGQSSNAMMMRDDDEEEYNFNEHFG
uniref:CP-type G domain-containing protein n=1 Tax=Chromera velia CCMP2878 TaxID=1169474 RepID=A0A0G4FFW4_9ALVE|mmetsp:Transcript_9087/g.17815  ORF Transcript_9087/g.17815 Transcript_9087/m.17815 type:complete len:635 (+) Transcript_9087:148-2052(+)|eukprot:Cvel_16641.t1-p1 / transcript=Cvel_16641.t1 / gene=Cvel_16641 / organism=Chromera_velia_CCMP2878 / gene_product=Guanine nucleotide-binding protein-like 3 homolog, putative / transcript_product=Guanine nucleotide-binding protein-like 3 homolog, putative / location=Cvel_scaffold1290:24702-29426(-) / protein_length=634 / sequence_SO=supercontig / SO=protein_coding / is_pseudo=false